MISGPDLVSSIKHLSSLSAAPKRAPTTAQEATPAAGPPQSFQTAHVPPLGAASFKSAGALGDSLAGLAAPVKTDVQSATRGLLPVDLSRASIHALSSAGGDPQRGPAVGRILFRGGHGGLPLAHASGAHARPPVAAVQHAPVSAGDLRRLAADLTERLSATPPLLAAAARLVRVDGVGAAAAVDTFSAAILNVAMIPGWPAPPPLRSASTDPPPLETALDALSESHLLEIVAALGGDEALLQETTASDDHDGRRKLLRAITILTFVIGVFITALRGEIEELLNDFGLVEGAKAPVAWAGRIRLRLK